MLFKYTAHLVKIKIIIGYFVVSPALNTCMLSDWFSLRFKPAINAGAQAVEILLNYGLIGFSGKEGVGMA